MPSFCVKYEKFVYWLIVFHLYRWFYAYFEYRFSVYENYVKGDQISSSEWSDLSFTHKNVNKRYTPYSFLGKYEKFVYRFFVNEFGVNGKSVFEIRVKPPFEMCQAAWAALATSGSPKMKYD